MPFWPVVLVSLIGVPVVLYVSGMGAIFAAAGLANGSRASRANAVIRGWLVFAWLLIGVFGAFGLAPAWRAWNGGDENFDGGLRAFLDWLAGVGAAGLAAVAIHALAALKPGQGAGQSRLLRVVRRLLLMLVVVPPWAAIVAWIAWPIALFFVRGRFEWPDAASGWTHTGEVAAILLLVVLVDEGLHAARRR